MNSTNPNALHHQRGVGMVEVLVAAFIIGFGLLGIAGLQITALQASSGAEIRATAMDLAMATADHVRANLVADNCYCRDTATCSVAGSPCAPAGVALATSDLAALDASASSSLPGGTLAITCADKITTDTDGCSAGSQMTITLTWLTQTDSFGTNNCATNPATCTDQIAMPFIPGRQ